MPSFPNGGVVTNLGLDLKAKWEAGATPVLSMLVMGDGVAEGGTDLKTLTSLVNELADWDISSATPLGDGRCQIRTNLTNEGLATGFYAKECGIIATDPDLGEILYAYAAADPGDFIPDESQAFQQIFDVVAITGSATSIIVSLNPNVANLTLADMQDHEAEIVDPTSDDDTEPKHLYDDQARKWEEHAEDYDLHQEFEAGTSMVFNQAAAPVGWTKKTDWADNATMIVGNTYGSGGSDSATSWTTAIGVEDHEPHVHPGTYHAHSMGIHGHQWLDHLGNGSNDRTYNSAGSIVALGQSALTGIKLQDATNYNGKMNADGWTQKVDPGDTNYSGSGDTGSGGPTSHSVNQDTYNSIYQIMITASKDAA